MSFTKRSILLPVLLAVLVAGVAVPFALADVEPPPVTVPTATVPTPVPDPAPAPTPAPAPKPKPKPASPSPPSPQATAPNSSGTVAPQRPSTPQPSGAPVKQPFAGKSPRPKAKKKAKRPAPKIAPAQKRASSKPARNTPRPTASGSSVTPAQKKWLKWILLLAVASLLLVMSLAVNTRDRRVEAPAYRRSRAPDRMPARRPRRRSRRDTTPIREVIPEVYRRGVTPHVAPPLPSAPVDEPQERIDHPPVALPEPVAEPEEESRPIAEHEEAPTPAAAVHPAADVSLDSLEAEGVPETAKQAERVQAESSPTAEQVDALAPLELPVAAPSVSDEPAPATAPAKPSDVDEGEPVAGEALIAPRAEPPSPAEVPVDEDQLQVGELVAEEDEMQLPTEEFCEIAIWRGYLKSRFYARLFTLDGMEYAVAESPTFRLSGNGAPDRSRAAEAAHNALIDSLAGEGWEPIPHEGAHWYELRFRRAFDQFTSVG